jgi:replicative DNA helicase
MTNYSSLLLDKAYLIIEREGKEIALVQILMETEKCVLVEMHDDEATTFWRKKSDAIFEVIDELTEEQIDTYDELCVEEEIDDYEEMEAEHQDVYL